MKNRNRLFIVWGVLVVLIVVGLTVLGFMMKSKFNEYDEVEKKLLDSGIKYIDIKFLYPEGKDIVKVTSEELIQNEFLDELKYHDDECTGYVTVKLAKVYQYKAYIKCGNYTTKGYEG